MSQDVAKRCTTCDCILPAGYADRRCEKCLSRRVMTDRRGKKNNRSNRLKKVEKAGLSLLMKSVEFGGTNIPHSSELLERLMMYFGGVNGFAAMCVKQFYDAPPGSSTRNKLLETVVRLTSKNTDQGGAKKPLTLWTEEELEKELDHRFKMAVQQYQGRIVDEQSQPSEEAPEDQSASPALGPNLLPAPAGGIEELARRANEQAARELEALPPDSAAGRVPQKPSE